MIVASFSDAGIKLPARAKQEGQLKVLCPMCSHKRTKSDEPCLSIGFNHEAKDGKVCHLFNCKHCHWSGAVHPSGIPEIERYEVSQPSNYKLPNPEDFSELVLDEETIEWFKDRGIGEDTLIHYKIKALYYTFRPNKPDEPAILFPAYKNRQLINAQYRNLGDSTTKEYKSISGAQLIFFGIDNILVDGLVESDTLFITEGHIDAMSVYEVGYPFVWSVPNGSPFEQEGEPPIKPPTLHYMNDPDAQYVFQKVKKVVFIGDNDHQGRRLVEELATRIGVEKCYRVRYPEGSKDANDVLRKHGREELIRLIENAEKMPVQGIVTISQVRDAVHTLYDAGPDTGLASGWENLDKIVRVGKGRIVVITGVPESGKTRFLMNWLIQLAKLHDIRTSIFSPESRPFANFVRIMIQIVTGKQFGLPGDEGRISQEEMNRAIDWLDRRFSFNTPPGRTIKELTDTWKAQLMADGTRYGVLDPFNYIYRPDNKTEAQVVLDSLTYLSDWAVTNQFTVFIIVHPTKVPINEKTGEYPVINPYNLYGSSHWFNATDTIVSIWRSIKDSRYPVNVFSLKTKQEELGKSNKSVRFNYDWQTGLYTPESADVYGGNTKNPMQNQPIDRYENEEYSNDGMTAETIQIQEESDLPPQPKRRSMRA